MRLLLTTWGGAGKWLAWLHLKMNRVKLNGVDLHHPGMDKK